MKFFIIAFFLGITAHLGFTQNPAKLVNPFVGTDFNGHTFPGATIPFGMVQLSPDTRIDGSWDGCSGYHYSDDKIYGFSHTHLSGTGVSDYGDILLMPQSGKPSFDQEVYARSFDHKNEWASPGYYTVVMDNKITAELTATKRVGLHRYTYPDATSKPSVIIDLEHRDHLEDGQITIVNDTTISIKRVSSAWAREQHCYAYMKFSQPFKHQFNEAKSKVLVTFPNDTKELLVKVGLSFTSEKGAEKNLIAEMNHWDFKRVRDEATVSWTEALNKIEVTDKDEEKLRTFYTALYHTMIHPNIATDVDGSYRGMDNKLHKADGFDYYTVFSLWDTFRATHPLFTIIERERTLDFIKSFLAMYEQGARLPVWELCANETDCMIGYHSVSVIADALVKGIDQFDVELAFEAMKKSATWDHLGLNEYMNNGFLSVDDEHESVSKTLEYAYDDWCIAQVALYLDQKDDYANYIKRSNAWKNLLDPETKLMRPRFNGGWLTPFNPREVNNHFTEANAWQYSFFVPHDVNGMIQSMGGNGAFEKQLDDLFSAPESTTGRTQADITGLVGQYAHGNEPSHHIAYLYNYIDKKEKTTERVHQILHDFYSSKPDGLIGNEDCGQMSAWYVMSAMGLYAVTPGKPKYALCKPYLDDYIVHLENGNTFSKSDIEKAYEKVGFMSHLDLTVEGMEKTLVAPDINFEYVPAPVVSATSISFDDSLELSFSVCQGCSVRYQFLKEDGSYDTEQSLSPTTISKTTTVRTYTVGSNGKWSRPIYATFYKNPHPDWKVRINADYNPQYSAGGDRALIDGIHGDENWRKGYWQGYQDQDFEVAIELNQPQEIQKVSATFLQDTRSWILYPTQVNFYVSTDGEVYNLIGQTQNTVDPKDYETQVQSLQVKMSEPAKAKFIKVMAKNYGTLPDWHQGSGGEAFIFVDEVSVE